MYYLFHEHHLLPGDYWRLPQGDKVVLRAFFLKDMEDRRERRR